MKIWNLICERCRLLWYSIFIVIFAKTYKTWWTLSNLVLFRKKHPMLVEKNLPFQSFWMGDLYYLCSVLMPRSCFWQGCGREPIYRKRRYLTLCPWRSGIWQFQKQLSNGKATKNAPLMCIVFFGLGQLYAYQRGLRRCSFRQLSNARASERGTSNKVVSHALFLCVALLDWK